MEHRSQELGLGLRILSLCLLLQTRCVLETKMLKPQTI